MPVPRDLTGVALLTPGATQGDTAFGNVPSIGVHQLRECVLHQWPKHRLQNGVGSSTPPFEMFDNFEIKTGGYPASLAVLPAR